MKTLILCGLAFLFLLPAAGRAETWQRLPYAACNQGLVKIGKRIFLFGGEDAPYHRSALFYSAEWRGIIKTAESGPSAKNP